VLIVAALVYWWRNPTRRLRATALKALKHVESTATDDALLARELEHLLRRYALSRFGADAVASLSGERWLGFVVARGGSAWAGEVGKDLLRAAYGGTVAAHRQQWLDGARGFIKARTGKLGAAP